MFELELDDGTVVEFDSEPNEEQINQVIGEISGSSILADEQQGKKTRGLFGTPIGEKSDILKSARVPSQLTRGVSSAMMDAVEPKFQSVPLNAAIRTPQTIASIGSDLFSSAIEPEAAAISGILKGLPLLSRPVNAVGRFIGKTAESTSGLNYKTPGVLAETVENPSLFFGPGKSKARELYKSVQNVNQISPDLQRISQPRAFVRKALQFVDDGTITPDEALEARKALDSIPENQITDVFKKKTREIFDAIAKQKFAEADKAYSQAVKSEALRSFWGINKGGTPSIVKGGLTLGLPMTSPALSPMVQGLTAAGVGVTRKMALPLLDNAFPSGIGANVMRRRFINEE